MAGTIWPFGPSLTRGPYTVIREFRTDIITSYSGREQRRALRQTPRKRIEYVTAKAGDCLREFDQSMASAQRQFLSIPERVRFVRLTAGIPSNAATVTIDPVPAWIVAGASLILMAPDRIAARTVFEVDGTDVTFEETETEAWPSTTRLHPALSGWLDANMNSPIVMRRGVTEANVVFHVAPGAGEGDAGGGGIEYDGSDRLPRDVPAVLTWWQRVLQDNSGDEALMGLAWYDSLGAQIGATEWAASEGYVGASYTQRTLAVVVPAAAVSVRLFMEFSIGAFAFCNSYIDDIELTVEGAAVTIPNPGAETDPTFHVLNPGPPSDIWNVSLGVIAVRITSPRTGAAHFSGYTGATGRAYQDITTPALPVFDIPVLGPGGLTGQVREVWLREPDRFAPMNRSFVQSGVGEVDYGFGRMERFFPVEFGTRMWDAQYTSADFDCAEEIRQLFARMKGRWGEFYMPTWQPDMIAASGIVDGNETLTVEGSGIATAHADSTVFKAIGIRKTDGTWIVRELTSIAQDYETSVLTVSSPWDESVALAAIDMICWLPIWRFASDILTMEWPFEDVARATLALQMLENLDAEII